MTNSVRPARFAGAVTLTAGLLLTSVLAGCQSTPESRVPIAGLAADTQPAFTQPIAVRVNNPSGGVVVTRVASLDRPEVKAKTRGNLPAAERVSASLAGSELSVARVDADPGVELVDIHVRLPEVRGVTINNAMGAARLIDVAGAVRVEVRDGPIQLRTDRALREGVHLQTTEGFVEAIMPATSSGVVELRSGSGRAMLRSRLGEWHQGRSGPGFHTGVLNGGTADISLLSGSGDVTLDLFEKPRQSDAWPID